MEICRVCNQKLSFDYEIEKYIKKLLHGNGKTERKEYKIKLKDKKDGVPIIKIYNGIKVVISVYATDYECEYEMEDPRED